MTDILIAKSNKRNWSVSTVSHFRNHMHPWVGWAEAQCFLSTTSTIPQSAL